MTLTKEEQISLTHINNLKAAEEMSHWSILYTNNGMDNNAEVKLTVLEEDKAVLITYCNEYAEETVSLSDFRYILGTLTLE